PCTPVYDWKGFNLYHPFSQSTCNVLRFAAKDVLQLAFIPFGNSRLKSVVSSAVKISGREFSIIALTDTGSRPVLYRAAFNEYTPISNMAPPPNSVFIFQ